MNFLVISIDSGGSFKIYISIYVWAVCVFLFVLFWLIPKIRNGKYFRRKGFEIDEAQFGIGQQVIRLRPNDLDRQIAYKIWIELVTRKIGLKIDLKDDVIVEIYDSWYKFFGVTRELIKDIPITKIRNSDTKKIVQVLIDVLNTGVRPHLTKWQAKYRKWYESQMNKPENEDRTPQELQALYPSYKELREDLLAVNVRLIKYRDKLLELIEN